MDPRIRQRRVQVRRAEGRRRLRFLVGLSAGLALLGAGVGATRSPLLDVDTIDVTGDVQTGRPSLLEAIEIERGDLMFDLDAAAAEGRLERLPWVATATVRRKLPATVTVSVIERAVAAVVPAAGERWALVDARGHVLDVLPTAPVDVVRVTGGRPLSGADDRVGGPARAALVVAEAVPPGLRTRVPEVAARSDGIELRLAPEGTVRFGPAEAVVPKLRALATLLDRVDLDGVVLIDLRVPDAPVLTRES